MKSFDFLVVCRNARTNEIKSQYLSKPYKIGSLLEFECDSWIVIGCVDFKTGKEFTETVSDAYILHRDELLGIGGDQV